MKYHLINILKNPVKPMFHRSTPIQIPLDHLYIPMKSRSPLQISMKITIKSREFIMHSSQSRGRCKWTRFPVLTSFFGETAPPNPWAFASRIPLVDGILPVQQHGCEPRQPLFWFPSAAASVLCASASDRHGRDPGAQLQTACSLPKAFVAQSLPLPSSGESGWGLPWCPGKNFWFSVFPFVVWLSAGARWRQLDPIQIPNSWLVDDDSPKYDNK